MGGVRRGRSSGSGFRLCGIGSLARGEVWLVIACEVCRLVREESRLAPGSLLAWGDVMEDLEWGSLGGLAMMSSVCSILGMRQIMRQYPFVVTYRMWL